MGRYDSEDPRVWYNLASAIVLQATKDYQAARRSDTMSTYMKNGIIREVERFIRSGWFRELTDINPEYLIRRLREQDPSRRGSYNVQL